MKLLVCVLLVVAVAYAEERPQVEDGKKIEKRGVVSSSHTYGGGYGYGGSTPPLATSSVSITRGNGPAISHVHQVTGSHAGPSLHGNAGVVHNYAGGYASGYGGLYGGVHGGAANVGMNAMNHNAGNAVKNAQQSGENGGSYGPAGLLSYGGGYGVTEQSNEGGNGYGASYGGGYSYGGSFGYSGHGMIKSGNMAGWTPIAKPASVSNGHNTFNAGGVSGEIYTPVKVGLKSSGFGLKKEKIKSITIQKELKYPVLKPYPVAVIKHVGVPVTHRVPYHVDKPYPVYVAKPYHVAVYKPVPYAVFKHVPYTVHYPVKVPVYEPIPVHVAKPVPYHVPVPVEVRVPQPYAVPKPVPIYVKDDHDSKLYSQDSQGVYGGAYAHHH